MRFRVGLFSSLVLSCAFMVALWPTETRAQERVALVIGNGAYKQVPALPNPPNDAAAVAGSFERLGFNVRRVTNGSFDDIRKALLEFGPKARAAEMAVVFYAGHGMEIGGENWLIPIDAAMKADTDAEHEAISLRGIMSTVSAASKLGLVILDACRDNPFAAKMTRTLRTRSVTRGFARIEPTGSVLVAYAAKDGTTAADGDGRNSPFTSALLHHLETPGLEINFLFRNVRDDVIIATNREQEPFVYGSLSREAIFLKASLTPPVGGAAPAALPQGPAADEVAWGFIKDSGNVEQLRRFIREFPDSRRRREAEERIDRLANIPATTSPFSSLPKSSVPSLPPDPPAASRPAAAPAKPVTRSETPRVAPKTNCFTFNGRQVCE